MRVVTARTALAAAGLAVLGLASSSFAASPVGSKPLVLTDPSGDAAFAGHGDIVKLTLSTAGTKVGKTYVPKTLVVTEVYADAIDMSGTTVYKASFDAPGCAGGVNLYAQPGSVLGNFGDCSDGTTAGTNSVTLDEPVIDGKTITYTISLSALGAKAGSVLGNVDLFTGYADPVVGEGPFELNGLVTSTVNDEVSSDAGFKVA